MAEILLATKLTIPPVRENLVLRSQLIEQLNSGLEKPLILVTAPAGFGKTTLLADWAARCQVPVAWLALDEGDSDPSRFFEYLLAALASIGVLPEAQNEENPPALQEMSTSLAHLINQVVTFKLDIVLVLDDYHRISAQLIHDMLAYLLDHLPSNLHLVIASRADPPLPIARLRARGQLIELHLQELRFSQVEADAFLNQVMHLDLDAGNVQTLYSRTEGWIAGLQMAVLSIQNIQDRAGFIESFSGSNRFILDYLMEEVLEQIPPDEKTFLLMTSILEQMCGSLCEAIVLDLQPGEGQVMLERLERSNLFVLPMDDQRAWYRYHRLFADLLRQKLRSSQLDRMGDLHLRASEWYVSNGYSFPAIDHALAARDFERAGDLIETAAEETLLRSHLATLLRWVKSLPPEQLQRRPVLRMYCAWALLFSGESLHEITILLKELAQEKDILPGQLAPLLAYMAVFQGQISKAIQLARQALLELPEEDRFLRSVATWIVNLGYVISGDRSAVPQTLERVIRLSQSVGNRMLSVMVMCSQADIYLSRGDLMLAEQLHQNALELAKDPHGNYLPIAGVVFTRLGEIYREWNRLDQAEEAILQGIQLLTPWNDMGTIYGYISLALVQQACGHATTANSTLSHAAQLAASFDVAQIDDRLVELFQQRVHLMQGELILVRKWIQERESASPIDLGDYGALLHQREQIILARALISLGNPQEALSLLTPILQILEKECRQRRMVEVLALIALAYQALGEQDDSILVVERALRMAEELGFVRVLLDEGKPMYDLLQTARRRGIVSSYLQYLLGQFSGEISQEPGPGRISQMEPLSPRELEVLSLIALGLTNQEIAERLYVTIRTVKFHTSNIISKLGVTNRTQAVARARELGLLAAE
jgi:ATP/maltotriose-dependent transcriptional regulator MalT